MIHKPTISGVLIIAIMVLAGCKATNTPQSSSSQDSPSPSDEKAQIKADKGQQKTEKSSSPSEEKAQTKADKGQQKTEKSSTCQKPVTDSTKVVEGEGCKIKGINDWEGEISGVPASGSKFTQLKIGMSPGQVVSLIGPPSDQGAHITGKAFIPFYHGSDKSRTEYVYKNQGRLLFAHGQWGSSAGLIWIIHNSSEPGYR